MTLHTNIVKYYVLAGTKNHYVPFGRPGQLYKNKGKTLS